MYKAVSIGLNNRSLIPVTEVDEFINKYLQKNSDKDIYESIYLYDESHVNQFETTKSLAGIRGLKTNKLVFDFDSPEFQESRNDAIKLVERLLTNNVLEDNIQIYFSGSKGIHVELKTNDNFSREEFENVVNSLAADLKTFDPKVKDEQRIFRYPLTRHGKTGLYKTPLSFNELKTLPEEKIKTIAKDPEETRYNKVNKWIKTPIILPPNIKNLKVKVKKNKNTQMSTLDLSKKPKHLTDAKFALQQGFFEEGERNEACMILASTYKYLNYDIEDTYNLIKAALRKRAKRLGLNEISDSDRQELWQTIIAPIYSPTWKGGTFSEEDGLLKLTIERYGLNKGLTDTTLVDLNSLSSHFMDFATNIDANTIKLGIDEIDKKLRITTSSLVAFLAAPSAGKSSVSFGILNTLSKSNEKAIFFSMDMSIPQVYQRLIQRHTGHSEDTIVENYKNKRTTQIEHYQNVLNSEYKNINFCFRSGMTAKEVRETIIQNEAKTGVKPRLVILDYLECMKAEGINDSAQSKAVIATELKGVANELGICIILLVQPRMMAGGPAGELNSYTDIKGSSVISEAAAQVITMSRPGFSPKNPEDDNYVTINVVKNRMGKLSSTDLHWDGLTGHIRSLSSEEENDLKVLREQIAKEKNNKSEELF